MADTKPKIGRPVEYSKELAAEICRRVMENNLSIVVKSDDMPSRSIIYDWLAVNPDFSDNYTRANKIRRDERFESMSSIPDTEQDVNRARLRVDILKWQLSKEEPKKYGDKTDITSGDKPITFIVNRGGDEQTDSND